jgi:hypothetical protein
MEMNKRLTCGSREMTTMAIVVGVVRIGILFILGFKILAYMLTVTAIAGLIGGGKGSLEQPRLLQADCFKRAFEALFLIIMAAYGFIVISNGFVELIGAADFINNHWPALMLSAMCITLGLARMQKLAMKLPVNSKQV